MYDCLEVETIQRPKSSSLRKNRRLNFDHYREHHCLQLRAAPYTGPHSLIRAFAAAQSLHLPTHNLPDGSLLILDLLCTEALLFQRRFPDLLAIYEPARPIPKG
ncbi:hypothetical protein [uncultured Deefgea sp.]|uniref:hypothetical protein n=1 Tax=uncultured Deefgea sp. TaxID=1304914 RepID=UPI00261E3345|nr:hypothetical protein [uncultured Deefgea sp.]